MARVGGDALDLVSLGKGFALRRSHKGKLAVATANVAAVTALDVVYLKTVDWDSQLITPRATITYWAAMYSSLMCKMAWSA
jgi:hypothetical protein